MTKYLRLPRDHHRPYALTLFLLILPVLLLIVLPVSGCDDDPELPATPVSGFIKVENYSSYDFHVLRFRVSGTLDWGPDYLGIDQYDNKNYIPSGYNVTYYMPPGRFDFLLENYDDEIYVEFRDITIGVNQTSTITVQ